MAEELFESIRARNQAMLDELREFTERLEELRVRFDRYFMGIEKIPPLRERADLEREMRNSRLIKSHKTEIKFRFKGLRSRLTTNARRWDRIMRLIEEGKFKRERGSLSAMGQRPAQGRQKDAPPSADRSVYESWMDAQKQVGKSGQVDFDRFKARLEAQRKKHQEKFGWSKVDYSVKIKNGKVALVARKGEKGEG